MHLNTPGFFIDPGHVGELAQVKIGIEFAIDASQQVEIKSSRHSQFVVVGLEQLRGGFLQVRSQKERISCLENTANLGQKFYSRGTIEIPDGAAQKQHEEMLAGPPVRGHLHQAIKILALKPHDADRINVAELALAHGQSGAGYFDRIIKCRLPPAECLQYPAGLLATAAAQFGDRERSVQARYDLTSMLLQQTFIGSRESVLGQIADHFKERRAYVVVEVLGRKFLLSRPRESSSHIGGEF